MAAVTADLETAPELLDAELRRDIAISERSREHGAAIVGPVTGLALSGAAETPPSRRVARMLLLTLPLRRNSDCSKSSEQGQK